MRYVLGVCALAPVIGLLAPAAAAQDYRGKLQGAVTDVNAAAVPGARVVLRNVETGVEVVRQTDADGRFLFDFVDPGNYLGR
jgi:protocatechuate 3,4-dioxygenase beta subunit